MTNSPKQYPPIWPSLTAAIVLVALLFGDGGGCNLPIVSTKPDRVTYVHAPKAVIPSPVIAALSELNTKGILATAFPEDTTDGAGEVPDQYRVALPAARASGIPSLVVQAGDRVLRTIKAPTTKEAVLGAAQ